MSTFRRATSFYVFVLFAGLAVIWTATLGALIWQQHTELRLLSTMNEYHLQSAEWSARAREAAATILAASNQGDGADRWEAERLSQYHEQIGDRLHRLTKIAQALRLREQDYGSDISAGTLEQFVAAVEAARASFASSDGSGTTAVRYEAMREPIRVLNLRADQLFRFHMAEHDAAAAQLAAQGQRNRWIFASVIFCVVAVGMSALVLVLRRIRRADAALRQSERQYRGILENMLDTYFRADTDGRIIIVSPSATELLDWPVDDLLGRRLADLFANPDEWDAFNTAIETGHGEVRHHEAPLRQRHGAVVWVSLSARLVQGDQGEPAGIEGIVRDVTEHHIAEAALRDSEARMAAIMDMAPEAIISVNAQQRIVLFNRAAEAIFGYGGDEMLGQPLDRLLPEHARGVHAAHIDAFSRARDRSRLMGRRGEITGLRKHGEEFPAEAAVSKYGSGSDMVFTIMLRDVTVNKRAERAARRALQQAESANAAKSKFLATMSHELRTPLNAVIGFSQILAQEIMGPLGSQAYKDYARDIESSGQHLLAIINDILDLARVDSGYIELNEAEVDIRELLQSCQRMLESQAQEKNVTISVTNGDPAPVLWGDQRLLRQTFLNLLSNAVKFTPADGSIEIRAVTPAAGGLTIYVTDTGIGMTDTMIEVAFEPFTQADGSLARQYEGTGLGLSLSKSFVELHDGDIAIDSTPGAGTTVTVTFPPARILHPDIAARRTRVGWADADAG